ncbi:MULTISPECIES: hydroxymethylglutaryl-CoA reductase, degradative [Aerococcus]|uniref:3-hydroxy-3-methylglutaryl coenzyme A reductase n=1 Tax=Aerococcus sanguinicola TaxID=119206 RepID=A0A5N1GHS2_9LACT|nr:MULTISPECIES: hydroxymethylglutaryl-CoA reductase, degradative [Aerococcus]KAA9300473.1 hydroxymethylglutaryl-CoA reductase, degradative [Aerococcus sanguinicola]MDK6369714.1 hydroxymethylglutaryl-CoA reductase, degradative [Aerococcus sp. UMB9870]MDK6680354.1 hydroxymethylglutaryl-CoA reductase, degradative [Aerococcus sp. UMB8608]MDK6686933.1 hydroxymethylglutaryl-CoA reductase, degradative [Aerococcus sp. UMB8623]MDK6940045.1 hydroxymethylglutaryl-CoA reductase, degradative [Aerococcus s
MSKKIWRHFHKKDLQERWQVLEEAGILSPESYQALTGGQGLSLEMADQMIENVITTYQIPMGLSLNLTVNDKAYIVPMVTEEPSVVAASNFAGQIVNAGSGFKAQVKSRLMTGQVCLTGPADPDLQNHFEDWVSAHEGDILDWARSAYPAILKYGGGPRAVRSAYYPYKDRGFYLIYLDVDTQEAMGANMMNTMLEAVKLKSCQALNQSLASDASPVFDPLMAILSNHADQCLVEVSCEIPARKLSRPGLAGSLVAQRIAYASDLAQVDPYRAATHNKGIMNGIDAVVVATGNDWRAIEAGAHSYAAKDGAYRGLATWDYDAQAETLRGQLCLPLAVGTVGGSIGIHPQAKLSQDLLGHLPAQELMQVIAAIGLAQNLAALRALVSEGIQSGHMALHARSVAIQVGAEGEEVAQLAAALADSSTINQETARELLAELRQEKNKY